MRGDLLFGVVFFNVFLRIDSLNLPEYVSLVDELLTNEVFLVDYTERALKLFSQPDYLYGKQSNHFPCEMPSMIVKDVPNSVHSLRPSDIQCVGALGDSLTAALGAHAVTPVGLFVENRGSSWSIGGDYTFNQMISLPNILREYNPHLTGFSTKSSVIFLNGQNASHNGLNVAKSGDRSYHMIDQSAILVDRFKSNEFCHPENDWKVITFFVGGNDLCVFCEDMAKHTPEKYTDYVRQALDYLQENVRRAFVNLVLVLDVRGVKELNAGGPVCQLLHSRTCPCAAFPSGNDSILLDQWFNQYHQNLIDLVNTGRYDRPEREDFTVVIQPFLAHTKLPRTLDGQIDYSFFAPDCFHFSGKGHSRAAVALWNNMLEPVAEKEWQWYDNEYVFRCPSNDRPYLFTRKNSQQSMERIPARK